MIKTYICHPYETFGTPKENLKKESAFSHFIKSEFLNDMELVRPFKLIDPDLPREEAMKECFRLIDDCDCLIAAPDAVHSEGCKAEIEYAKKKGLMVLQFGCKVINSGKYDFHHRS